MIADDRSASVLTLGEVDLEFIDLIARCYGLLLIEVADDAAIPGSYWGEPEAGLIGGTIYARSDTPLHSVLHEMCHLIVIEPARRHAIHTDASTSQAEEDATCYLQIVLGDAIPNVGRDRIQSDMDAWGYTFRLGSARAWFERDADDAREWLTARGLLPAHA
ncbi:MAG: hypothetical protein ABJB01_12160 [Rudaea sp.]